MTMTSNELNFDMYDRDLYADPYPTFRRLRDEAPLYRNEEYNFWAVSRQQDVARVLSERDTFSSAKGGVYQIASLGMDMPPGIFIFEDPPGHTIHRSLVSRLFTPRAIARIEDRIVALFEGAAEELVGRDRFDWIKDFAHMLPIQVVGMLFGLPEADLGELRAIFHKAQNEDTAADGAAFAGLGEAAVWFGDYLDARVANPTDDIMSQLLRVEFEDATGTTRVLERDELLNFLILITGAGSDTTVNLLGWAGQLLGDHPEQRKMLVDDPSLIPNAVEELLRYESISYHICRTTTRDVELHGQTVPADSLMVTLPGSANRDERHVDDPDRFDITRAPSQHYTLSFGPHFCLGASLAKLEARVAIEAILKRVPDWSVDHSGAELTGGIDTRGYQRLPVEI